jgi:hypothetical protein
VGHGTINVRIARATACPNDDQLVRLIERGPVDDTLGDIEHHVVIRAIGAHRWSRLWAA